MTDVQRLTINETLDGTDVIAQAKTGTGKTLAFLMPVIQHILKDKRLGRRSHGRAPVDIRALIISPTRELAEQIATEARKVVSSTDIRVQTAVGGTGKREALQRLKREGCHLLIGTPGRVQDLISDEYSGVDLRHIETFVLDEADRLLDIGFAPDIERIQSFMPNREERDRQTLMFSATVPREVVSLVRQTLKPGFKFVRTTDPNEVPTHERIPQKVVFTRALENRLPAIFELAHKAIKAHEQDAQNNMPFKAIVYFPSTAEVSLAAEAFSNMRGSLDGSSASNFAHPLAPARIIEIHSRLTQAQRTRNAAMFKTSKSAILFSSDVTARGMDFPDVSHVIQLGLPRNDDDYIHRLGRTGRAGKSGEGWLIVQEEQMRDFRRGLGAQLPIKEDGSVKSAGADLSVDLADVPSDVQPFVKFVLDGMKATPFPQKAQAYAAMFGILQSHGYRHKQDLVDDLNNLARYGWGLEELPRVNPGLVEKLGLSKTTGLNIQEFRRGSRTLDNDSYGSRGKDRFSGLFGAIKDDPFEQRAPRRRNDDSFRDRSRSRSRF